MERADRISRLARGAMSVDVSVSLAEVFSISAMHERGMPHSWFTQTMMRTGLSRWVPFI